MTDLELAKKLRSWARARAGCNIGRELQGKSPLDSDLLYDAARRLEVRPGGVIEDETGWWQVTHVEDGWAWLTNRDGTERQVQLRNLGAVTYDKEAS